MRVLFHFIITMGVYFGYLAPAVAVLPDEVLPDQRLEARARAISSQLRCLVCRNETIDDSNAALARDLRLLVRNRLLAGDSDGEVVDFIVARYGEYVLLKPRFRGATLVLWFFPLFILIAGVVYLVFIAGHKKTDAPLPLSCEEEKRVRHLLYDETGW